MMGPYQFNNYPYYPTTYTPVTKSEVTKVSGRNGATAFPLAPNSSALLLDETAPIVWLKTTDGAGYPTLTPYDISVHHDEPTVDTKSLEMRIAKLEEIINEQSNSWSTKHSEASNEQHESGSTNDRNFQKRK